MRFHLRPVLALAAMVSLCLAIRDDYGFYFDDGQAFAGAMLALLFAAAACLLPECSFRLTLPGDAVSESDGDAFLLACAALLLGAVNINSTQTSYADVVIARRLLVFLALAGFGITLAVLLFHHRDVLFAPIDRADLQRHRVLLVAAFLAGALAMIAARVPLAGLGLFAWASFVALFGVGVLLFLRRYVLFGPPVQGDPRKLGRLFAITLAVGFALRGCVLYASPDPVIDVYALLTQFTDHLLAGRNPYAEDIVSPYQSQRALRYGIGDPYDPRPAGYPPHPYLLAAPFRAFRADPRWANVVGDCAAAAALFAVARRRGRTLVGFLAGSVWLYVPRTTFMIEQAWYEPMLAGLFGIGLWLVEGVGWRLWIGYMLVGLALTAKQYGLPLLPALAWPHRQRWKPILLGLLVGGLVMLPWLLWSPHDFIDIVLKKHLDRPSQHDRAVTVAGACHHLFGRLPQREAMWAIAAALIAAVSWRGPRQGAAVALIIGTALLAFCVFHTQGFFNYFYLCQYLWLLGFVGLLSKRSEQLDQP